MKRGMNLHQAQHFKILVTMWSSRFSAESTKHFSGIVSSSVTLVCFFASKTAIASEPIYKLCLHIILGKWGRDNDAKKIKSRIGSGLIYYQILHRNFIKANSLTDSKEYEN